MKIKLKKINKMPCNCGKKNQTSQPKKIVKPSPRVVGGNGSAIRRIIKRAK